jgi:hypothetical protein
MGAKGGPIKLMAVRHIGDSWDSNNSADASHMMLSSRDGFAILPGGNFEVRGVMKKGDAGVKQNKQKSIANIEMHGGMVGSVDSVTEDRVGEAADDDEAVTGEA